MNFENNTITGYNFNDRVKLFFKKGDKLERITINSGGRDALYATMSTSDWLRDATGQDVFVTFSTLKDGDLRYTVFFLLS